MTARHELGTGISAGGQSPNALQNKLIDSLLANPNLVLFSDFNASRVSLSGGVHTVLNRKSSSPVHLIGVSGADNLTTTTTGLPVGGAMTAAGVFDGATVLKGTGIFPPASGASFTMLFLINADPASYNIAASSRNIYGSVTTLISTRQLVQTGGSSLTARVGSNAGYNDAAQVIPVGHWTYVFQQYDNSSKIQKIRCAGMPEVSHTGSAETWVSPDIYVGARRETAAGGWIGKMGAVLGWLSSSGSGGRLLDAGNEAALATALAYARVMTGQYDIRGVINS